MPVIQLYFDTIFLDMILNRKDQQMAYPYKKMDSADFDYIRSVTAPQRVKIGEDISEDYYHDEMPNYGSSPRTTITTRCPITGHIPPNSMWRSSPRRRFPSS